MDGTSEGLRRKGKTKNPKIPTEATKPAKITTGLPKKQQKSKSSQAHQMKKRLHHEKRTKMKQHTRNTNQTNPPHPAINRHHPARANAQEKNQFGSDITWFPKSKRGKRDQDELTQSETTSETKSEEFRKELEAIPNSLEMSQDEIKDWINN